MGLPLKVETLPSTKQNPEYKEKTMITHSSDLKKGKVKWYNEVKGFVLVHRNDDRQNFAGLILCTGIELLTELHNVNSGST